MTTLDAEATFARLQKLRERMDRLELAPDKNEWQFTRQLIKALSDAVAKSRKSSIPVSQKVRGDAPEPVKAEWQELVAVLSRKGIRSESRRSALRRQESAAPGV